MSCSDKVVPSASSLVISWWRVPVATTTVQSASDSYSTVGHYRLRMDTELRSLGSVDSPTWKEL